MAQTLSDLQTIPEDLKETPNTQEGSLGINGLREGPDLQDYGWVGEHYGHFFPIAESIW